MPCQSEPPFGYEEERREELDKLTRMLCAAISYIVHIDTYNGFLYNIEHQEELGLSIKEVDGWWQNHKQVDAKRKAMEEAKRKEEQLRQQALSKLTDIEKKVLGL